MATARGPSGVVIVGAGLKETVCARQTTAVSASSEQTTMMNFKPRYWSRKLQLAVIDGAPMWFFWFVQI